MEEMITTIEGLMADIAKVEKRTPFLTVANGGLQTAKHNLQTHIQSLEPKVKSPESKVQSPKSK